MPCDHKAPVSIWDKFCIISVHNCQCFTSSPTAHEPIFHLKWMQIYLQKDTVQRLECPFDIWWLETDLDTPYFFPHTHHSVCIYPFSPFQNRVLRERLLHMEERLRASQEDSDRLRMEREGLREGLQELQAKLREKETEVRDCCRLQGWWTKTKQTSQWWQNWSWIMLK